MLVEVMVGAVVLAIVTTALLNGIDGAQSQGTTNKARSTAAALAEQDQERLRALPVATLASCCTPAEPHGHRSRGRLHGHVERRLGDRPGRTDQLLQQLQDRRRT